MNSFKHLIKDIRGQAMVEYGLLLTLIAVALISTIVALRGSLETKFDSIKTAITNAT